MLAILIFISLWVTTIIASYLMFREAYKRGGDVGFVEIIFVLFPFVNVFISSACLLAVAPKLGEGYIKKFFFIK